MKCPLDCHVRHCLVAELEWTKLELQRARAWSKAWKHRLKNPPATGRQAKLKPAQVRAIRAALAAGAKQSAIAREFGVCTATVNHINTGRTWRSRP